MIRLIAAIDRKRGIARNGVMPWNIPIDLAYFSKQTKLYGGHVLSGGKTFRNEYHGHGLTGRRNFILTRQKTKLNGVEVINNLDKFIKSCSDLDLWIAGGEEIFEFMLKKDYADELYLTLIDADFSCDQFFPEYESRFHLTSAGEVLEQNGLKFTFTRYSR